MGFEFFSTQNYLMKALGISCVQRCVCYSCILLKVQYLTWYERVRVFEKGRNKDNLWDANFRATSKSHYLDSLILLV